MDLGGKPRIFGNIHISPKPELRQFWGADSPYSSTTFKGKTEIEETRRWIWLSVARSSPWMPPSFQLVRVRWTLPLERRGEGTDQRPLRHVAEVQWSRSAVTFFRTILNKDVYRISLKSLEALIFQEIWERTLHFKTLSDGKPQAVEFIN